MRSIAPAHYSKLWLRNFRGFKIAREIPFAPLTFLVGPNSSGKSSICDAFLFLTQSNVFPGDETFLVPTWIGPLVDLGSYEDTVFAHSTDGSMGIQVELLIDSARAAGPAFLPAGTQSVRFEFAIRPTGPRGHFSLIRARDSGSDASMTLRFRAAPRHAIQLEFPGLVRNRSISLDRMRPDVNYAVIASHDINQALKKRERGALRRRSSLRLRDAGWRRLASHLRPGPFASFTGGTQRVTSGRAAPQRWFTGSVPDELSPSYLRKTFTGVYPAMIEAVDGGDISRKSPVVFSKRQLESVLRGLGIATKISAEHLSPYHSAIHMKDSITKITSNIIDMGYGASQVIPVISACISNRVGPLFVEQPEIHLHPRAQGTVAELLCATSLRRQVVVETHSVHMINRARVLVARGILDHRKVIINFVHRTEEGSRVHTIPIEENGDFGADWPEGFFDERYEDTMTLLRLKSEVVKR